VILPSKTTGFDAETSGFFSKATVAEQKSIAFAVNATHFAEKWIPFSEK
jgi:hypothetical protein